MIPAITILLITSYSGYFIATWMNYKINTNRLYNKTGLCSNIKKLNILHVYGIILLGLPLFFLDYITAIFFRGPVMITEENILVLLGLLALAVFLGLKTVHTNYPNLFVEVNSIHEKSLQLYLPIRILFLVVYESFFRGILLAACMFYTSIEWAIAINVVLYTLMHAFSGKQEILLCPVFGTLLCLLTLWFHSFLPAAALHVTLAFSHESIVIKKILNKKITSYE